MKDFMSNRQIYLFPFSLFTALVFICFPLTACGQRMTEEQALQTIRQLTKDEKLPSEPIIADIDSRFANTKTGALAKLLRARIRFENGDFQGAADILNTNVIAQKTSLGDYALWLRGRAFAKAQKPSEAMEVFARLITQFPNSLRFQEAKMLWAEIAIQSGRAGEVPLFLEDLNAKNNPESLLATAKSFELSGNQSQAISFYRRTYFYGAGTEASRQAEQKLTAAAQPLTPQTADEAKMRADKLFAAKNYSEAITAYSNLLAFFPNSGTSAIHLNRISAFGATKRMAEAQTAFNLIPSSAKEKEEAYYRLAIAFADARQWTQARQIADEMRQKFPAGSWTSKTFGTLGTKARDAKNKLEESYYFSSTLTNYPNAVEVAQAQFELAWLEHESGNVQKSSQMLTEHLARYADKDTSFRGRAGYWSARDSERAGKIAEACALYDAVIYRYSANWYGYLATQRLSAMQQQGKCQTPTNFPKDSLVGKAAANLKTVTVASETATEREIARLTRSEELGTVGLFDWAIDELKEAAKTATNSPKVNLTLAKHHRLKGDNVNALLALAKSYPDYSQMFPEEMGSEEWDIFYPLHHWEQIKLWAGQRNLDKYQVAGLIRQESVFNPRAKSNANAYGLMQLLLPTARSTARKYGNSSTITIDSLFQPALNIELGTAYMRDQFDRFGRIEYVAAAYNAGPNRVPQWRATLPLEMDEFVEEIPFKETRSYVQGVIRNSAQYRRLYDENGNFKPNVGTKPVRNTVDTQTRERVAAEFPDIKLDDSKIAEE